MWSFTLCVFVPELYLIKRVSMVLIWRTSAASILSLKLCWEIGGIRSDLWTYITWKPLIMTWKDHSVLYSFDNLSFPHPEQTKIGRRMLKCVNGKIWGTGHRNWTVEILQVLFPDTVLHMCWENSHQHLWDGGCFLSFWNCEHFLSYFSLFWVSSSQH